MSEAPRLARRGEPAYDPLAVQARWQARWTADRLDEVDTAQVDGRGSLQRASTERKFYNLVEFPYPSAEGLHVGHAYTYCGADTHGRWLRMNGRTVFQPIGFDSFGIHTENYALRVGRHPAPLTATTTARYRQQLKRLGAAWDWGHELSTSDPAYYRWTQWLFLRLYEAGLAVRREAPVIWCPSCLTVLANEQVEGERCERCDTRVTTRVMRQWFLRITAYADRLRDGLDGLDWPETAKRSQREWIGGLHDWLISRQRYWGPPIPIVYCEGSGGCGTVPVPEDQLPVLLPEVRDIRPTGTGASPLAAVASFVHTTCPSCGGPARRETDVSDTFLDSAWYFLRYPSADLDEVAWSPERTARFLPVDLYLGGPEHVNRHHLYARFVTMAMHDQGLLPFAEPFPRLRLHGLLRKDGRKMSKRRGNVVDPDAYVGRVGADNLRMYLLFCGPWELGGDFSDAALAGIERFSARVWRLVTEPHQPGPGGVDLRPLDRAVAAVGRDLGRLRFNTALAALMELVRWARRQRAALSAAEWERVARTLVLLLAPFAPHLAEELWSRGGGPYSVHRQPWPDHDPSALQAERVNLVVQVNGKRRDVVAAPAGLSRQEALALAMDSERVRRQLAGRAPVRTVYLPDRLLNLVV
jgi:leucyl-tRNA synthetase